MQYKIIELAHRDGDINETESNLIEATLNKHAKDGWRLTGTQFLPWAVGEDDNPQDYIGWGHLLLFLEKSDRVKN